MNRTKNWANKITRCVRCESTIYWDDSANPQMLRLGNNHLFTCMEQGCKLLSMNLPSECCEKEELDLLRLGLEKIGIVGDDARLVALRMNKTTAAA